VPSNAPPLFLVHGSDDIISQPEHSVVMYLALKKAGVPAELHIYAGTTHDFGVRQTWRPTNAAGARGWTSGFHPRQFWLPLSGPGCR
jgi:acetyl esterase/lipase